jgi:DNA-directed RNA polymerase specialized sigma24 family protein
MRDRLHRILESLSAEDRLALELYVVDDLPAADIARVLGLPNAKAVYNRVYRSLEAMRLRLDEAGISREDL